jgi:chromatin remodeling complex protein RSC6
LLEHFAKKIEKKTCTNFAKIIHHLIEAREFLNCYLLKNKGKKEIFMAKKKKATKKAAKKKTGARKSGLTQQTYSLSSELQAIVGSSKLTRPQIVKKLWAYIKAHKCQDTKNKRMICPDKKLSEVIGKKPVDMLKLAGHLNKHIKK